jgi:hypothetical protein
LVSAVERKSKKEYSPGTLRNGFNDGLGSIMSVAEETW